ncbi:DUF6087 family protein [Streptomyces sp. NPDC059382]|uniref:DUF6087 family protein n=1 Tax=Streptomyces sp. NPDC059382 TaxID=3346816 RepID=UPI0036B40232
MSFTPDDPADEPLEAWAARREGRRRAVGELRAVPLGPGTARGGHVQPELPRAVVRWDGFTWEPVTVAPDYAAARRIIDPTAPAETVPVPGYSPAPLRAGRGRHRRT